MTAELRILRSDTANPPVLQSLFGNVELLGEFRRRQEFVHAALLDIGRLTCIPPYPRYRGIAINYADLYHDVVAEQLDIGYGGWVWWANSVVGHAHVRLVDRQGRLVVAETLVTNPGPPLGPPMSEAVRRIPFSRIEAWCNERDTATRIRHLMNRGPGGTSGQPPKSPVAPFFKVADKDRTSSPDSPSAAVDLALSVGNRAVAEGRKRPYPDSFYEEVARIYQAAAASTRGPAEAIADANRVPPTTVHRWVRVARSRGKLPPAARGKAG